VKTYTSLEAFDTDARNIFFAKDIRLSAQVSIFERDPAGYTVSFEPYFNLSLPQSELDLQRATLQNHLSPQWLLRIVELDALIAALERAPCVADSRALLRRGRVPLLEFSMIKGQLFLWVLHTPALREQHSDICLADLFKSVHEKLLRR
jgi:hypothetical protein